jgi:hypothetical protein
MRARRLVEEYFDDPVFHRTSPILPKNFPKLSCKGTVFESLESEDREKVMTAS